MDKQKEENKNFGTGFNDSINPTAGSGIDVTQFNKETESEDKKTKKFNTVLESEEPLFEKYKPPQPVEVSTNQNKIPLPGILNLDIKKNFIPPKKSVNKLLIIIAIVLILVLGILTLLSRIGGDNGIIDQGKKGEIVWWGITYEESDLSDLISEFEKNSQGLTIVYRKQSKEDYRERLTSSLASGKGPDIFEFHNSWPPMFRKDLSTLPENIMSISDYQETYYQGIVNDLTLDGKIVGIPLDYDSLVLFINEPLFSSATREVPTTWDETKDLAVLFSQEDERGNLIQAGIPLGLTENVDHWQEIFSLMLYQNGANPGKPEFGKTSSVAEFYNSFYVEHEVWNEGFPDSTIAFAREQAAMYVGPSNRAVDIIRINPSLRFRTFEIPQLPKDDPLAPDFSYSTYWAEGVWDRSADKQDAWKLLSYLSTKESMEKINSKVKSRTGVEKPFPRKDMAELLSKDPIAGAVVRLAPYSVSWYLHGHTNDGETGLNSRLSEAYKPLISATKNIDRGKIDIALAEVTTILKAFLIE